MAIRRRGKQQSDRSQSAAAAPHRGDSTFDNATTRVETAEDGGTLFDDTVAPTEDNLGDMAEATRVAGPYPRLAEPPPTMPQTVDPMADPPVGWLVVVRGPGKGQVLTLGHGLNIIGRGPTNRVVIDFGDNNISRANHARIIYEPRERRFHLTHGDGTNLTYLDNELVMAPTALESGSEIQLGDTTTVRFMGFCGAGFDWPDVES